MELDSKQTPQAGSSVRQSDSNQKDSKLLRNLGHSITNPTPSQSKFKENAITMKTFQNTSQLKDNEWTIAADSKLDQRKVS